MSLVKGAMLLLLLAVIGINAAPGPEDCDGLNKTLSAQDLHKLQIYGEWLLVWRTSNEPGHRLGGKPINVTMKSELLPDNRTILFTVRMFGVLEYKMETSRPSDPAEAEKHFLHIDYFINADERYNQSGSLDFYDSCSDCLVVEHRIEAEDVSLGQFLLMYRRIGSPMDPELLKASHSDYEKLADCLGLPHDKPYIYQQPEDVPQSLSYRLTV